MLKITDDTAHNAFILEPSGSLEKADLKALNERFDKRVAETGQVPNLVVHTRDFPGWSDFGAMLDHFDFILDHHRLIAKIALVSDSRILDMVPWVARHFVSARIRHFPSGDLQGALAWVAEADDDPAHVTVMDGFPDDVIGISVHGIITGQDYSERIVPLIEDRLKRHDRIKLLYRIGPEFEAFAPGAVWSDARVGITHLTQFAKIALVSDIEWIRHATRVFAPLIPGQVHVFAETDMDQAKVWITSPTDD